MWSMLLNRATHFTQNVLTWRTKRRRFRHLLVHQCEMLNVLPILNCCQRLNQDPWFAELEVVQVWRSLRRPLPAAVLTQRQQFKRNKTPTVRVLHSVFNRFFYSPHCSFSKPVLFKQQMSARCKTKQLSRQEWKTTPVGVIILNKINHEQVVHHRDWGGL